MNRTPNHPHMTFNTLRFLNRAIDAEVLKEQQRMDHAVCLFKSASDKARKDAHKLFEMRLLEIQHMKDELKFAAAESNRTHPNPRMREFWNV